MVIGNGWLLAIGCFYLLVSVQNKINMNIIMHTDEDMDAYNEVLVMIPGDTAGRRTILIQTIDMVYIIYILYNILLNIF